MSQVKNPFNLGLAFGLVKIIYKELRSWLREEAKKTETPVDDWMLDILDKLLLD